MIASIEGYLESINESVALIKPSEGGLTYQVLLPAFAAARLGGAIGQKVILSTLYFIESQGQGATMIPRLAGFLTIEDRAFFELFTTCKGIGNRKALRAMSLEIGQLAAAIADRDTALLQSLPEIGRRTAETVVATLHGKVDRFLNNQVFGDSVTALSGAVQQPGGASVARQALDVLMQLGENRADAVQWIDQVIADSETRPNDIQKMVESVYRLKASR